MDLNLILSIVFSNRFTNYNRLMNGIQFISVSKPSSNYLLSSLVAFMRSIELQELS